MNRLICVFFMLPLLALLVGSHPALGMEMAEIEAIQANAELAVEQTIGQLEAATASGNEEAIKLALQALDLAMANFAVICDFHDRALGGEPFDPAVLARCNAIANGLLDMSVRIAAGDLAGARAHFGAAGALAALNPPPPPITDQILARLDPALQDRMATAVALAVEAIGSATAAGGPAPTGLVPLLLLRTDIASPT